jgi:hypothetical protein
MTYVARECEEPYIYSRTSTHCTDRTKRVKDAKAEAQKEIDEYRSKKEEEYKKFESEVCTWYLSKDNY